MPTGSNWTLEVVPRLKSNQIRKSAIWFSALLSFPAAQKKNQLLLWGYEVHRSSLADIKGEECPISLGVSWQQTTVNWEVEHGGTHKDLMIEVGSKVMASRGQLPQRSTQFMDGQVGVHAKPSQLLRGCVPPPYGGGTHPRGHRRVCLDQISDYHQNSHEGLSQTSIWLPCTKSELTAIPLCTDGIFSLVTAALAAEHDIQTPRDIQRTMVSETSNTTMVMSQKTVKEMP